LVESINIDAFKYDGRTIEASYKAQQRVTTIIMAAIEKAGSEDRQILALHNKAVMHPQILMVAKNKNDMQKIEAVRSGQYLRE
jgi:hypothetical protein